MHLHRLRCALWPRQRTGQFPLVIALSTKSRHTWLYFKWLLITAGSVIFRQFRIKNVACWPNPTMQNGGNLVLTS